jgi:hypothetical protein
MSDPKKNWLQASKATHGDGNLSGQASVKGKQSMSPIGTFGDGTNGKSAPKGTNQATKTPARFGNKSGGSKEPAGGGKAVYAKGLMSKKGK